MPYVDPADQATAEILADVEQRTHEAYEQAWTEMSKKAEDRLISFDKAKQKSLEQLRAGEITQAEYDSWVLRQTSMNNQLTSLTNDLAQDLHNTNKIAARIANQAMPDVYAINANYGTYDILQQAVDAGQITPGYARMLMSDARAATGSTMGMSGSWNLYNHDSAELLLKTEWSISPEPGKNALLPKPSPQKKKDLAKLKKKNPDVLWNQQKLQSAVTQGLLQGESPTQLAKRLQKVAKMDEVQAIRNARTMTTNVQNMGRQRAYQNARDMDIKLVIQWYATLDGATRHSHRKIHGETKKNTKTAKFSNGCKWPGDPDGPAAEVYNCRCTTVSWVDGYEHETVRDSEWLQQQNLEFDDWQKGMNKATTAAAANPTPTSNIPTPSNAATQPADPYEDAIQNAREYSYAEHKADNYSDEFWDGLTDEERDGVYAYTGSDYTTMNGLLRGTVEWDDVDNPARWRYEINDCADALSHRGIANDTILYRGMGSEMSLRRALGLENLSMREFEQVTNSGNLKGLSFVEKGFASTGIDAGSGWNKEVVMEIVAPKGTQGFFISHVSRYKSENEFLLQRGSIFRIYDTERLTDGTLKLKVVVTGTEPLVPV